MPLMPGSDRATIGQNIGELIRSGRDPKVAAAISYRKAGKYKKPRKKLRLSDYVGS